MFRRRSQTDFPARIGTGLTLLQGGDRIGALQLFAEISHSNDPNVLRGLGLAYQQAGEMQFAEHVIRRAVTAGSRDALNDLGVLMKQAGRPAEAEQVLRQAADAGDPNAMNNLGNLFSERGDQQNATWFWHQAAEAGNARAMCSLGVYLASTGHPEARRWYDRAVTRLPEAPEIREQLDALAALVTGQAGAQATPPVPPPPAPPSAADPLDTPTQTTAPVTPGSVAPGQATPGLATPGQATPGPSTPPPATPLPFWSPPPISTPTPPGTPPPGTPPPGTRPPGTPGQYSPAPVAQSPGRAPLAPAHGSPPLPGQPPTPPAAAIGAWAEDFADHGAGVQTSATVHRPRSSPRPGPVPPMPVAAERPESPVPAQREVPEETQTGPVTPADPAVLARGTTTGPGPVSPPPVSPPTADPPPIGPPAPDPPPVSPPTASLPPIGPPTASLPPVGPPAAGLPRAVPTLEPPTLIARAVLPAPPPGHADAVDVADALRTADRLREEYLATGNPGTLGQALEASQLATDSVPAGDLATRGLVLGLRCALLRLAFTRDKDQTKLAEAIDAGRAAKSLVRPSDPSFSRTLISLASALQEEYGRTRNPAILTEALALYRDGVHVLPEGHPEVPGLQANICNVLMTQGLVDPRLLTEAVEAGRQAVRLSDPESPAFPARLASLAMALVAHHANNQGPPSELDEAERLFSQALATLPADHALRSQIRGYVDAVAALRQRPQ
jgi:TPR repeat protein